MGKLVHTYKELNAIAGSWTTVNINNDYIKGADHFTIRYKGESVTFQSDNLKEVASCACDYNGLSWGEFMRFNPDDYINMQNK